MTGGHVTTGRWSASRRPYTRTPVRIVGVLGLAGGMLSLVPASRAIAADPIITNFAATPSTVTSADGRVMLSATVTNASGCTLSAVPAIFGPIDVMCGNDNAPTPYKKRVVIPLDTTSTGATYTFTLSVTGTFDSSVTATASTTVTVAPDAGASPLTDVQSTVGEGFDAEDGYCSLLNAGGVDCWGSGTVGELGNGKFYGSAIKPSGHAVPVQVVGVGGVGTLSRVSSLSPDDDGGYCALLTSSKVDCWGGGHDGELGDGSFHREDRAFGSATPVQVVSVKGAGTLDNVSSLTSEPGGYCALLTSGGVDCWGDGRYGQLGNGVAYTKADGSAKPVQVAGVGGTETLSGVVSLVADTAYGGYCALLTTGGVDCWGYGQFGELGNGQTYDSPPYGSPTPVPVLGVGGNGMLSGVTSLEDDGNGTFCAVLTSGGVDCWGFNQFGELGDGQDSQDTGPSGSPTPVQVEDVGGNGFLSGVASLTGEIGNVDGAFCAVLTTGGVDCWGDGQDGALGNGAVSISAVPVEVSDVGGNGTLSAVARLTGNDFGFCAVLTSGGVDCWGNDHDGELGDGEVISDNPPGGSATPVPVVGLDDTGTLSGVSSLIGDSQGYCAVLVTGDEVCWGYGADGELGNGVPYPNDAFPLGSAIPVLVLTVGS
jgi:hypothetical protein